MTQQPQFDPHAGSNAQRYFRGMSPDQFQQFGLNEIAYIKPVQQGGAQGFAIHAADGTLLTVQNALVNAIHLTRMNDLVPVTVH
jgi:hypothetical protein